MKKSQDKIIIIYTNNDNNNYNKNSENYNNKTVINQTCAINPSIYLTLFTQQK
jgi:hypothetical protein